MNHLSQTQSLSQGGYGMNGGLFLLIDKVYGEKRLIKKKLSE